MASQSAVVKYGGSSIGIGAGNAVAFFSLPYLEKLQGSPFDDPVVAVAMGGTLVGVFFMELGKIGRGLKYMFDRIFPAKYDHDHQQHHEGDS